MPVLAIDIGGTAIKSALVANDMQMHLSEEIPTPQDNLDHLVNTICALHAAAGTVDGIAISLPGRINSQTGHVYAGGALHYNYGTDLGPLLQQKLKVPVILENAAKAATRAELWHGALRGVDTGAVLIFGTGLGGGIVTHGRLLSGPHGGAGELSMLVHNDNEFPQPWSVQANNCSTTGLLIRCCKALNLPYEISYGNGPGTRSFPIDGRRVFELYHKGNPRIAAALLDFALAAARLIYNLAGILDIEKAAFGGVISSQRC